MKLLQQIVLAVSSVDVGHDDTSTIKIGTLPGEIPPRNPPIFNPIRAPYQEPSLETAKRVEDLLIRMPMREKMAQLMQGEIERWVDFESGQINVTAMKDHMFYHSGMLRVSHPSSTQEIAFEGGHKLQDWIMNDTSLSLPAIIQCEGLHGLGLPNSTVFSSPIGFGASWNPDLVEETAAMIGQEARAIGITQLFAPSADLARDPRHGRVEESMSEDPFHGGEMVAAFVRGLWKSKVASMVKHLAAFGNSEQGLNTGPVHGGERELRTTYLPPFQRALQEQGAFTVMTSFNSYDGIPSVMNKHLLTDVLRGEWDFQYWTTSDYGAPSRLCTDFHMCKSDPVDAESVTMKTLTAGLDTEGGGSFNYDSVPQLVNQGTLDSRIVDEAVRRVLRAKFDMGLFEDPFPAAPKEDWSSLIHTDRALKVAKQLDLESIVLLENNDEVLPLSSSTGRIAVIGPMADEMNYGGYIASRPHGITPLQGIRNKVSEGTAVDFARGCDPWSNSEEGFDEAVKTAASADIAIVFVGTWARDLKGQQERLNATTGEGYDANDLRLVGAQNRLIEEVISTGVPTIVVLSSGKPVAEPWLSDSTTALLQQFYPSEQGGAALADVLFGDYNPSGRLPISYPRDVGSLPITYDYLDSGRQVLEPGYTDSDGEIHLGRGYIHGTPMPWYEFGYGKTYTTFEYSDISVFPEYAGKNDIVTVTIVVRNTGKRDGQDVVQLYITDPESSVVTPNKQLKAFQKVSVRSEESIHVHLQVRARDLGLWNADMQYVVETGEFIAKVGGSSQDIKQEISFFVL